MSRLRWGRAHRCCAVAEAGDNTRVESLTEPVQGVW